MSPGWQLALGILAPVLGVIGVVGAAVLARNAQRETRVVADLREDVATLKRERDEAERRRRILEDYVHELRDHISRGKNPPPPDWPAALLER